MLASHYAPRCPVILVDTQDEADAAARDRPGSVVLGVTDDLAQYARTLYSSIAGGRRRRRIMRHRRAPARGGLGHAVRDRLLKAAAPRR